MAEWEVCPVLGNMPSTGKYIQYWEVCPVLGSMSSIGKYFHVRLNVGMNHTFNQT